MTKNFPFKWIFWLQIVWLALICFLGGWWGTLIIKQSNQILRLEKMSGISSPLSELQWNKIHRMLFWESITFFALLLVVTLLLIWFTWRDSLRSKSIQAFFASVTHEFRTPLTSIRLQTETIVEGLAKWENQSLKNPALRLLQDTLRLELQVNRMLELARIEGGGSLVIQPIPIRDWVTRTLNSWREEKRWEYLESGEIQFEAEIEDDVIEADVGALEVILKNLTENSIRHSGRTKNGVKGQASVIPLKIQIKALKNEHTETNFLTLAVRDNGQGAQGISAKILGKLFHKGAESSGAGIGLYLIRNLMTRMGGSADFTCESAGGFQVNLKFRKSQNV